MMFSDWPWRHWRAEHPEKTALRLNGEQISWEQLCQRVDALASGFAQQGVKADDGVMLQANNQPETLLAWLALLQCGARLLPVNPQLPRPLLEVLLPQMTLRFALVLNGEGGYAGLSALGMRSLAGSAGVAWQADRHL
jgi:O-succinylbenzoic acid--CoA ligase